MSKLLQSKWAALVLGSLAYAFVTAWALHPRVLLVNAASAIQAQRAAEESFEAGPSWTFHNPEMDQIMAEMKSEREAQRKRAAELDQMQARLEAERQEICVVTQTVARLRAEMDSTVTRVTQEESANVRKLAKVYADMSPEGASRILKEMEDDQIVKILGMMKESETAPILEALGMDNTADAKRAAALSNRLRLLLREPPKATAPQ